jgi:carbamoyl-phosphate synthase small subunit
MSRRGPAVLVLEDGTVMRGSAYGAIGSTFGEAVFSTGMTGYQETLTDPSYHRQIVVMTAPHVGNTGVNDEDPESSRIWVSGYVVRDPSRIASNWRATRGLEQELRDQGIVGLCDVDTRALTRRLRERGAMRMGIFSGDLAQAPVDDLLGRVLASPGIKTMTPRLMAERGIDVHVLPAATSPRDVLGLGADGVFFSNGPGDPATADHAVGVMEAVLAASVPVFGICFGNQILGRALGLGTYKLRYGHRGINQPVQDLRTGKIEITAHNHGFAVDAPRTGIFQTPFGAARVSHVCRNDDVVEGLECLDVPAFSVQYHPEAAAGPHDASSLFDEFVDLMQRSN